jgi:hypothetical protein
LYSQGEIVFKGEKLFDLFIGSSTLNSEKASFTFQGPGEFLLS